MWFWRERRGNIDLGFTDRRDGVSTGDYQSLNLGAGVADDPAAVQANRDLLADQLGVDRVHFMNQVHGANVVVVDADGPHESADGMLTDVPGVALGVLVADCTPVLLYDAAGPVIGVVHAGRPGLAQSVVPEAVAAARTLGARDLHAVVGPAICGRCYEVPAGMREEVAAVAPASRARTWHGTPSLDVTAGVVEQLADDEVSLTWVAGCTAESDQLFSHRGAGPRTGRYAGVIVRR